MSSPSERPRLHRPAVITSLLNQYGLSPKKALGQNFLADGNTIRRIVDAVDIVPGDIVIEVGPGLGSLTQGLVEAGARVIAIEKDRGLVGFLRDFFRGQPNVEIVEADVLNVNLKDVLPTGVTSCKVAANLPYYVTSPIMMHVLESDLPVERLVLMMQKEVAERLVARPGTKEYGVLTVATSYWAETERVATVPPTVFIPVPKVSSEIVLLKPRTDKIDIGDEITFFNVVKSAFGQRRKTLRNALKTTGFSLDVIDDALALTRIDGRRRGETLTTEEFSRLSLKLSDD